jgi:signal transduction histidine kinase
MVTRPTAAPVYVLDAGQSRAIADALLPLLAEVRTALGADTGLVVYRPDSAPGDVVALAANTTGAVDQPLLNEPLLIRSPLPRRRPRLVADLDVTSAVRDLRLRLRSAVAVPWRDSFGTGTVIVGNVARPLPPASEYHVHTRCARRVSSVVRRGRRNGARQVDIDLRTALADVADATASSDDATAALGAILVSARDLFGSEVAYLSLPEYDPETFTFDQVLGIRTAQFRHLRIRLGQGLGGLARSLQRPVRSLDYASDDRLSAAPVAETVREGIVSAMAAPLLVEEEVKAVLYVGDRHLRPFTQTDEDLLTEFAGYATLGLKRRAVEEYRSAAVARQERERLAFALHDTVVRRLLEIGFEAEAAARRGDEDLRRRMAVIGSAAEQCMEALRGQLAALTAESPSNRAGEVLERITEVRQAGGARRTSELLGAPGDLLSTATADALVRIGQEALVNAELHSGCRHEHVVLELTAGSAVLTVEDDGCGLDPARLDRALADPGAHLGMRAMRASAARAGGHLTVGPSARGGLAVRAIIPR